MNLPIKKYSLALGTLALSLCYCLCSCRYADAILIAPGETFSGSEVVSEDLVNQGSVIGNGPGSNDRLVFDTSTTVSGSGYFENTLVLGVFAPGNSPGIVSGTNQAFGGTIEFELGGTTPGFGSGQHDQINDSGTIELVGLPTLSILSFDGFVPTLGDEFQILTWTTGLVGDFGNVLTDPTFSLVGIKFQQLIENRGGAGSLTLVAVPEANVLFIWSAFTLGVFLRKSHLRRKYYEDASAMIHCSNTYY